MVRATVVIITVRYQFESGKGNFLNKMRINKGLKLVIDTTMNLIMQAESESPLVNQRFKQLVTANNIVPFARVKAIA